MLILQKFSSRRCPSLRPGRSAPLPLLHGAGQSASRPVGQSASRPVGQSASRPVGQSASRPAASNQQPAASGRAQRPAVLVPASSQQPAARAQRSVGSVGYRFARASVLWAVLAIGFQVYAMLRAVCSWKRALSPLLK